jgi:pimeloyl-ACP methyl ester carboxylesterase
VRKNGRVTEPIDEFSFQAEQAADAGIDGPLPRGERLSLTLADGRTVSALRYVPSDAQSSSPVVTFLHGAGLNAHTWDTTIMGLGLPALAIDLPGHGDSSWREDRAYTGTTLAPDVAAAIETWTDRPQVLVGQSLGGLTAAAVAASRPDLVRELVVIDITPGLDPNAGAAQIRAFFSGPTDWASRDEMVERALSFGFGGSPRAAARGVYFNSRIRPDGRAEWKHHFAHLANALADQPVAEVVVETGADAPHDAVAAVLSEQGWHDLAAVSAPITLIRGDRGYVSEADAATFAERVPGASVETVPAGHNVQEDMPAELGRRIAEIARKG